MVALLLELTAPSTRLWLIGQHLIPPVQMRRSCCFESFCCVPAPRVHEAKMALADTVHVARISNWIFTPLPVSGFALSDSAAILEPKANSPHWALTSCSSHTTTFDRCAGFA